MGPGWQGDLLHSGSGLCASVTCHSSWAQAIPPTLSGSQMPCSLGSLQLLSTDYPTNREGDLSVTPVSLAVSLHRMSSILQNRGLNRCFLVLRAENSCLGMIFWILSPSILQHSASIGHGSNVQYLTEAGLMLVVT